MTSIKQVIQAYTACGFKIKAILIDGQFKHIQQLIEQKGMAVDDAMGQFLWTRHFLAVQGHHVPTMRIYQDNMSTTLLAENGRSSSSKRTCHINIQYFYVGDKIRKR